MLSGRGRGRGGSTGARAVLRSQGPQEPDKRPGVKTVASQALGSSGRASSRSPARGQAASGELRGVTSSLQIIHSVLSSFKELCSSFVLVESLMSFPITNNSLYRSFFR